MNKPIKVVRAKAYWVLPCGHRIPAKIVDAAKGIVEWPAMEIAWEVPKQTQPTKRPRR